MTTDELVDRNEILPLLGEVKRSGEWLMAYCPAHADGAKHGGRAGQSLGLSDTGVLKCFAGCDFKDVMAKLRGPTPILPRYIAAPAPGRLARVYQYLDADGAVIAEKGRFETPGGQKTFRWRKPGEERWLGGVNLKEMPLYGVHLLKQRPAEPVYFVEGEKACEACWEAGLLAVTHGGGAGIKDFGSALDALRGRTVYLWADNDAPGRAYMNLLAVKLAGIADVRLVTPPLALPEKGDAFDYFASGGTVLGLEAASPYEPVVTILSDDSLRVVMPTVAGAVTLDFSEMEKGPRELNCALVITCPGQEPYNERLNLDSSTARNQLRIDMEKLYGKEYNWTALLNKAIYRARDTYLTQERATDIFNVPDPIGEPMLVAPLLVADGPTVWFGDGSSGKSYLSFLLALCSSHGVDFCGMKVPTLPVMVIDYEDSATNVKRRMNRLAAGLGGGVLPLGVIYWDARGIPLKDQVEAIKRSCEKHGVGWLIIDSAAPACGGPPEDSVSALAFFRALKRIGLPALVIAHISKQGENNTHKPFGSVFWHNEARRTWFVKRIQEEDSDEIDVGLYNRKVNDGRKPLPLGFHLSFTGTDGPVRVTPKSLNEVPELLSETSANNQVWAALSQSMTIAEIMEETGLPFRTVERVLLRGKFVKAGTAESSTRGGRPANRWARLA